MSPIAMKLTNQIFGLLLAAVAVQFTPNAFKVLGVLRGLSTYRLGLSAIGYSVLMRISHSEKSQQDFGSQSQRLIVCDPPWGKRLDDGALISQIPAEGTADLLPLTHRTLPLLPFVST